jgi:hypothetical protein
MVCCFPVIKKIVLHLAMKKWLIHRLLTAKRHISDSPAYTVPNDEMKTTVTWEDNFLYIHGDVLTIGIVFLILIIPFRFVSVNFVSHRFRFASVNFVSFWWILFRLVWFRFISVYFVSRFVLH